MLTDVTFVNIAIYILLGILLMSINMKIDVTTIPIHYTSVFLNLMNFTYLFRV